MTTPASYVTVEKTDLELVEKDKVIVEIPKPKINKSNEISTISELFSAAEPIDFFYMIVGSLGALTTGVSIPFFNVLFGKILDALNSDPNSFATKLNLIIYSFIVVAGVNLITGYAQVYLWTLTGERQTQKLREMYIRAVLSQEIGWFDTIGAGELSTKVADTLGKIQDGIGRKAGDLIQYFAQFVAAFVVGLYLSPKLTGVLLASFPLIGGAGFFMITAITAAQQQSLSQYAKAGGLATEALGSIRTVTALNAQIEAINKYRIFLFEAMQVGIKKGFNVGFGNGAVFGACFGTYALG